MPQRAAGAIPEQFHLSGIVRVVVFLARARGNPMATAKEFVEFWLQNSVHPDEQFGLKQGRTDVRQLADNLVRAAEGQGFTREQMEAELGGDIDAYIRTSIDAQNATEADRLNRE